MTGKELKKRREDNGWTQQQLAELTGQSAKSITNHESAKKVPNGALKKYNKVFGGSPDEGLQFVKGGISITMDDLVKFADSNKKAFFGHRYFKREIELLVAKKLLEVTSDPQKFKEFLAS